MSDRSAHDDRSRQRQRAHLRLVHSRPGAETRAYGPLLPADLLDLDAYAAVRPQWRARAAEHLAQRTLALDPFLYLHFEDRLGVLLRVQEWLHIERIFGAQSIQDELDAWNPRIPDGGNLKATLRIQHPDAGRRSQEIARLGGIERRVYARVAGHAPQTAVVDAPPAPGGPAASATRFFLRFELAPAAIMALRAGASLAFGVDDPRLRTETACGETLRLALLEDLR